MRNFIQNFNVLKLLINMGIFLAFFRGLYVFTGDAHSIASAICFVGSIFAAILMYYIEQEKG